jgi:hypothetical protein
VLFAWQPASGHFFLSKVEWTVDAFGITQSHIIMVALRREVSCEFKLSIISFSLQSFVSSSDLHEEFTKRACQRVQMWGTGWGSLACLTLFRVSPLLALNLSNIPKRG